MKTEIEKINPESPDSTILEKAGNLLRKGEIVAFPTETVYGLGADALSKTASEKIYAAKGRPSDNPLIIHICKIEDLTQIVKEIPKELPILANKFWPGPLTIIMKKAKSVPYETTGGLETVAVRMPNHKVALELIEKGGGFIAAPSANSSGRPSPTSAEHVFEDMNGKIPLILDCGSVSIGLESTIIDLTGEVPLILRPGFITQKDLTQALGREVKMDPGIQRAQSVERPKAPGMKYRHYAPKAPMLIVDGTKERVILEIQRRIDEDCREGKKVGIICTEETKDSYKSGICKEIGKRSHPETIARNLFSILRQFDEEGVVQIYSECFNEDGLGEAIMNRLMKAASHQIIHI